MSIASKDSNSGEGAYCGQLERMGSSCSTCFGGDHDRRKESSVPSSRSQQAAQPSYYRPSDPPSLEQDRALKRQQMGEAAEARIQNLERRGVQTTGGNLSSKLEQQRKSPYEPEIVHQQPLKRVEEALISAGFHNRIPLNSNVFAAGDGDAVEDCPIGYYRFHFWKSEEQWKEHENWVASTDVTGPICISLMEDCSGYGRLSFYRLVIRSIFGFKSVILSKEEIEAFFGGRRPNSLRIISVALYQYIEHEKQRMLAMEEELGSFSVRTDLSTMSAMSERARFLPHSRLRDADAVSAQAYGNALSRRRSNLTESVLLETVRSLNDPLHSPNETFSPSSSSPSPSPSPHSPTPSLSPSPSSSPLPSNNSANIASLPSGDRSCGSVRRRFRELCGVNASELAKSFTQVKDKDLYYSLLELEQSLNCKVFHFDVVLCRDGEDRTCLGPNLEVMEGLLGERTSKDLFQQASQLLSKQGRVPSQLLEQLEQLRSKQPPVVSLQPASVDTEERVRLCKHQASEFAMVERNYIRKLEMLDEWFLSPLDPHSTLPDPYQIRGIIDVAAYKLIFEGVRIFLDIHRGILRRLCGEDCRTLSDERIRYLVEEGSLSNGHIAKEIISLYHNKDFTEYRTVLNDYEERSAHLKRLAAAKPRLQQHIEMAANDERCERQGIAELMSSVFQHIPRYKLQIENMIRATPASDPTLTLLNTAFCCISSTLDALNDLADYFKATKETFSIAQRVCNSDVVLITSSRRFATKMAAYEVLRGETQFSRRLTLYLFNDAVMGARKIRRSTGRLEVLTHSEQQQQYRPPRENSSNRGASQKGGHPTHEFIFLAKLEGISIQRQDSKAKAKNRQVKTFILELPLESIVYHRGRHQQLSGCADEFGSILRLVPKKQEKLNMFLERFQHLQHQRFLAESPAQIYHRRAFDRQVFFHVFEQADYLKWHHRNRVAVLVLDQPHLPPLQMLFPEDGDCKALMVLQVLQSAFRFNIKGRDLIYASTECFEAVREFQSSEQIIGRFLLSCNTLATPPSSCLHHVHSDQLPHVTDMYPPFGPQLRLVQQQQLEAFVGPYCKGLSHKLRELMNRMNASKVGEMVNPAQVIDGETSSIYSVENVAIETGDLGPTVDTKPRTRLASLNNKGSSLGSKLSSLFKSPLRNSSIAICPSKGLPNNHPSNASPLSSIPE